MTADRLAMRCIATGALLMLAGVILGAFGAHGLQSLLTPKQLSSYVTGVTYQQLHSMGLVLIGVIAQVTPPSPWLKRAAVLFVIGIVLFSGSIYALTFRRTALARDACTGRRHELHAGLGSGGRACVALEGQRLAGRRLTVDGERPSRKNSTDVFHGWCRSAGTFLSSVAIGFGIPTSAGCSTSYQR